MNRYVTGFGILYVTGLVILGATSGIIFASISNGVLRSIVAVTLGAASGYLIFRLLMISRTTTAPYATPPLRNLKKGNTNGTMTFNDSIWINAPSRKMREYVGSLELWPGCCIYP